LPVPRDEEHRVRGGDQGDRREPSRFAPRRPPDGQPDQEREGHQPDDELDGERRSRTAVQNSSSVCREAASATAKATQPAIMIAKLA